MDGVPAAVVRLDVHLVDPQDRSEVGHFVSAANTPATVNSVAAAVAALDQAHFQMSSPISSAPRCPRLRASEKSIVSVSPSSLSGGERCPTPSLNTLIS